MEKLSDLITKQIVEHLAKTSIDLDLINSYLTASPPDIEKAHFIAHRMKGGLGTLGFSGACKVAHALETYLKPENHEPNVLLGREMAHFADLQQEIKKIKLEDSSLLSSYLVTGK